MEPSGDSPLPAPRDGNDSFSHGPHPRGQTLEWVLVITVLVVVMALPLLALGLGGGSPGGGKLPAPDLHVSVVLVTILWGVVLVALPVKLLARWRAPRPLPERAPWGILDAVILALAALVVLLPPILLGLIPPRQEIAEELSTSDLLFSGMFGVAGIVVVLAWVRLRHGVGLRQFGIHRQGWLASVLWGFFLYFSAMPLILGSFFLGLLVHKWTETDVQVHPMAPLISGGETSLLTLLSAIVLAVVVAPAFEEIIFRGFLYPAFRNLFGPRLALLAVATLFAGLHPTVTHFYSLLVLAAIFTYLYERTGNLIAPIAVHALHNGIVVALSLMIG